ncbi:MAG TPA: AMP-binding protein [Streptosporangiaceae bacterium]|nr:AMP-binding protein [Streptosporangiaceae bacterium]
MTNRSVSPGRPPHSRRLHAVLVDRPGPRLFELLAAALDGSGPAIAPLDARLPEARLAEVLAALAPSSVEGPEGVTTLRSGQEKGVAEGTAVVVGTSGSTGVPKGVELSAAALMHSARASLARVGARPGERWLCCLPVTYIAGLQVLVRSLVSGTDPVLAERADAQTVAASGCAHVSLVPTQLRRLLDVDIPTNQDMARPLAGFRSVLLGGAAAPAGLLEAARAAGAPVVTTYGMTETCGGCVYDGIPLDGVQIRIGDGERIWIGGPVLFSGYVQGGSGGMGPPGIDCPRVPGDGWFRTGDLGRVDPAGRLVVRGRADEVINTGGYKVVPGEVAAALQAHPGVRDAAVLGQPDPEWGERVVAVVVPADPADPPTIELLRLHVRERLPRYAAPSRVVMVDAVPMLPSGKHDLARLRRELLWREQSEAESVTY